MRDSSGCKPLDHYSKLSTMCFEILSHLIFVVNSQILFTSFVVEIIRNCLIGIFQTAAGNCHHLLQG